MTAAYAYADMAHDRDLCEFESKQDMIESRMATLNKKCWLEYLATGYIADLEWSEADLEVMAQQQEITFKEIIYNECAERVLVEWD